MCEMQSKLTIKTPVRRPCCCLGFFIFNFERILRSVLVFPSLTLNKHMITGKFGSVLQIMSYLYVRKVKTYEQFFSLSVSVELRRLLMDKIFPFIMNYYLEKITRIKMSFFGIADWISIEKWILVSKSNSYLGVSKRPGHSVIAVNIGSPKIVTSPVIANQKNSKSPIYC